MTNIVLPPQFAKADVFRSGRLAICSYTDLMKSIYSISKGQLITLWVFGAIGWFFTWESVDYGHEVGTFFFVLIPFVLIFITLGWRNHKKIRD